MPRTLEPNQRANMLGPGAAATGTLIGAGRGQLQHVSWRLWCVGWALRLGVEAACTMRRLPAAWARIWAAALLPWAIETREDAVTTASWLRGGAQRSQPCGLRDGRVGETGRGGYRPE